MAVTVVAADLLLSVPRVVLTLGPEKDATGDTIPACAVVGIAPGVLTCLLAGSSRVVPEQFNFLIKGG